MRRAAKVDDNHTKIVATIREAGFSVHNTSVVGQGFPDFVCCYGGRCFLVEVKDGAKPPSKRRLTAQQEVFHRECKGSIEVITTEAQARLWAGAMKVLVDYAEDKKAAQK